MHALARGDREGLSPLLLHGPSGVGKSRLLDGLAAEWIRRRPGDSLARTDAAGFADACFDAANEGASDAPPPGEPGPAPGDVGGLGWAGLRERFRSVGLLIIDDLEGLERIPLACEELIHTLDALDASGGSLAAACRTPPNQWPRTHWPPRLVNRLAGGLAVRVEPPGPALLRRYALERARAGGVVLAAEAVESLASSADGYRTLDGWIARLALGARAAGPRGRTSALKPMDLATVSSILEDEADLATAGWTVERIARFVAARFGVKLSALRGAGRSAAVVEARHLAMHLARSHTALSFAAIGAYFGGRDPATVRHACKAAAARIAADPSIGALSAPLPPPRPRSPE
ncbi:Chromosomal replication initiator protein DnaA [Aquisphaera giovannonii]|uniref:Chromosomal replication initiator protein DnaA n=2 Tax=Aquisphaera giovannonii TaxID=406548 RepID=A0A5B9VSR8_9BACT|nr:Chromosomal replication initiator protein DnaA [Aquisphaera giovannonii]